MIKNDKILHFLSGLGIAFITSFILGDFIKELWYFLIIIPTLVGIAKEYVWDKYIAKGQIDWKDALATSLGGVAFVLLIQLLSLIP